MADNIFDILVEIPAGSSIKYEQDEETGRIYVDRFVPTPMAYPENYGAVEGVKGKDGDLLDALVLTSQPIAPGCWIKARVIGMLEMEDEAGIDTKIIAVPTVKVDPFYAHVNEIDDIGDAVKNKIRHFFEHYKELEPGKWVKLKDFLPKEKAFADIVSSMKKG